MIPVNMVGFVAVTRGINEETHPGPAIMEMILTQLTRLCWEHLIDPIGTLEITYLKAMVGPWDAYRWELLR